MAFVDSLNSLLEVAIQNNLSTPYLVGGLPRNILLSKSDPSLKKGSIRDVDITTGNFDVKPLAEAFAKKFGGELLQLEENHIEVKYRDVMYDFSKNIRYKDIDQWLYSENIRTPTDLQRETFSRDFTVNTVLMSLDFSKIIDLTGRGRKDIEDKILICPLNCELAIRTDPKRILRAYHLQAKYGFKFSEELKHAVSTSIDYVGTINRRYSSEMVNKILRENEQMLEILIADGILKRVPMTKHVKQLLIKHKRLLEII